MNDSPLRASLRLSVVIPTCDTRELVLACLRSLSIPRGLEADAETLVVDDGSRDGTAEAVEREFPTTRLVRSETTTGFTAAANRGLREARGEVLLLLNSDTEVQEGGLPALLAAFDGDPRLGVAGGSLFFPDGTPQWSGGREPSRIWLFGLASGLPALLGRLPGYRRIRPASGFVGEVDWVTGAALAVRRAAWEAVGPLDEGLAGYGQDIDFCLRVRDAGWRVAVVPDLRVIHHQGSTFRRGVAGDDLRFDPEALMRDLVLLFAKRKGRREGWRTALLLAWGTRARLLGRRLVNPLLPPSRRPARRRDTAAFEAAVARLRALAGELRG